MHPLHQKHLPPLFVLFALWLLFFWQLLTLVMVDRVSLKQGDFSGQFVAFATYQYQRMSQFEIPLWNPYNNSGLPFIGDSQAAVFYPPRLLSIMLAKFTNSWGYHTLELEMAFHVLGYTFAMYALVYQLVHSRWAGIFSAVIAGYAGYLSGYPPLQLAVLEAGVWFPLVILCVHHATPSRGLRLFWIVWGGVALGMSWLAGHPQTSWFLTYVAVAYLCFRLWHVSIPTSKRVRLMVRAVALFGIITLGTTAITFLPAAEYLLDTARAGMGFAEKGNGFPLQDILQVILPQVVSLYSPLHLGYVGLFWIGASLFSPHRESRFWLACAGVGLLLSFGQHTVIFSALYNLLPGLRFFRGQERAAYVVVNTFAVVIGYGVVAWLERSPTHSARLHRVTRDMAIGMSGLLGVVFILWQGFPTQYGHLIQPVALVWGVMLAVGWGVRLANPQRVLTILLVACIFELFSLYSATSATYDPQPALAQLDFSPNERHAPILQDATVPARVDGFRGLTDNYGSLYQLYDARGISPLFLDGLYAVQQPPFTQLDRFEINPTFWELNAVEYVYSGEARLPVDSEPIWEGSDRWGHIWLHRLTNPRPFALLLNRVDVVNSDAFARALLLDPRYQPRQSIVLNTAPTAPLQTDLPLIGEATVIEFEPEAITLTVESNQSAILSLAHPHYNGWVAHLNERSVPLLRAYGGWSAVEIPSGKHTLTLRYRPLSFTIGWVLTALTLTGVILISAVRNLFGVHHAE
ncbi:MAG: YfhO family protein [Phototrophicaceae bacterium]